MNETSTHFKVPIAAEDRERCLGPDGAAAHVSRVLRMIQGKWKLAILFRLYADPSLRTSQLMRDIVGISQKMLTQHLRELEEDCLIERIDFATKPLHVEYRLSRQGWQLMPLLVEARRFSTNHPDRK
jgi:DNA-binding HxlR family transcriptional regulator